MTSVPKTPETSAFTRRKPSSELWHPHVDALPRTAAERFVVTPVIFFARLIAGCIALIIWTIVVGPLWLVLLLRTLAVFGCSMAWSLFNGRQPMDVRNLDYLAGYWAKGYAHIIDIFRGRMPVDIAPPVASPWNPYQEALIAIGLYTWFLITVATLNSWLPFVSKITSAIGYCLWLAITTLGGFLVWLLSTILRLAI